MYNVLAGTRVLGTADNLWLSSIREMTPIYRLGDPNVADWIRSSVRWKAVFEGQLDFAAPEELAIQGPDGWFVYTGTRLLEYALDACTYEFLNARPATHEETLVFNIWNARGKRITDPK